VRLFILAGEPSGDRIGADLVRRLRERVPLKVSGVGGEHLAAEGVSSLFPMSDLSVMGLNDVLKRLPLLLWRIRQTAAAILRQQPDLVVLIDSQVFCETVAKRLRKAGFAGKVLLYVSPAVWAWKPERAPALKPVYDEVLAVLPFEPAVMAKLGGPPTSYVGHPALSHTLLRATQPERGPMLLLPGSRQGELRKHLPVMEEVAKAFAGHPRITGFVLPTPRHEKSRVHEAVTNWATPVQVTSDPEEKQMAFAEAVAAAAVTGTVTLELALSGVPMVTTYVGEKAQLKRAQKYNLRFASLPNILAGERLVPEILSLQQEPAAVIAEMTRLLDEPGVMDAQLQGFANIRGDMEKGAPEAPLADAVDRVLAHLSAG
jgi:lipid-A-disaccharide synthase